jgi:hypothetical protein
VIPHDEDRHVAQQIPGPSSTNLTNEDEDQLRLLSIFHYVVAGMHALCAMFPILHLAIGAALVFAPEKLTSPEGEPPPLLVGWLFMMVAGGLMTLGATLAACIAVAGRFLSQRRRYMFCLVTACVMAALSMPFGTILGVFTIIVLMRPSVKAAFGYPRVVSA